MACFHLTLKLGLALYEDNKLKCILSQYIVLRSLRNHATFLNIGTAKYIVSFTQSLVLTINLHFTQDGKEQTINGCIQADALAARWMKDQVINLKWDVCICVCVVSNALHIFTYRMKVQS